MQISYKAGNPDETTAGGTLRGVYLVPKFTTTDATPRQFWTRALATGKHVRVKVEVVAHDNATGNLAEWQVRNAFSQSNGGTSKRGGTANGSNDSAVNDFAGQNGKITFGDPSGTGIVTVSAVGKAGTNIDWTITVTYQEGV